MVHRASSSQNQLGLRSSNHKGARGVTVALTPVRQSLEAGHEVEHLLFQNLVTGQSVNRCAGGLRVLTPEGR
jgi:hypothetical protein